MGLARTEDIFEKTTELYERFYDEHNLDENSDFGHYTRKQAIIEADCLNSTLCEILEYYNLRGTQDVDAFYQEDAKIRSIEELNKRYGLSLDSTN